ncbi:MAG: hypothetical protein Ta2A_22660 [Treponemataceae bacterium]|nr:MAG: hypothetical protein Ta2A_22660 [Treponemataceae bacterium]
MHKPVRFVQYAAFCVCSLAAASLFTGCATLRPMTKGAVSDVGGITEIHRFQYYVSPAIELTATEVVKEANINKSGAASVKEIAYRNIVKIDNFTMGALMDSRIGDDGLMTLEICFEEKASDSDKRLSFKQDGLGFENKFYIVYKDPQKRILKYGNSEYSLETRTGERAYLKIDLDKKKIEKERVRRAKGRKVQ